MKVNKILTMLLASTSISAAFGADIQINSWGDLYNNRENLNNNYTLNSPISLDGHLTIGTWDSGTVGYWNLDGSNWELSGGNSDKAFSVQNNISAFVFNNLNLKEIKNSGENGGVIWNGGKNGVISNSVFKSSGTKYGGVIYNQGEIVSINNVLFEDNFINSGAGGAIYNSDSRTIAEIKNSNFISNSAYDNSSNGGAIYNANGTINLIENTNFGNSDTQNSGNTAAGEGGAIYNNGTIGNINNSNFYYNGSTNSGKNGGAIYNNGEIQEIANTTFSENGKKIEYRIDYTSVGGAIYNSGTIGATGTKGISNVTFNENQSQYGGGAIYNQTTGKITKITDSNFTKNYSGDEGGGAIKNKGEITLIDNTKFQGNKADTALGSTVDAKGGAIYNAGGTIDKISNSEFYSNTSTDFGGAISNVGGTISEITNGTFGSTTLPANSGASGGAINNQDSGIIQKITSSDFINNVALETSNLVQGNGGAIRNYNNSQINLIDNVNFTSNHAGGLKEEYQTGAQSVYGGAIYIAENSIINALQNVTFSNNKISAGHKTGVYTGNGFGGAIYIGNGSYIDNMTNLSFTDNIVTGTNTYGGAIYITKDVSDVITIVGANFERNAAKCTEGGDIALGGAIYSEKSLSLVADGSDEKTQNIYISDNYTEDKNGRVQNAIFMDTINSGSEDISLTLSGINGGKVEINDEIDGGRVNLGVVARTGEEYKLNLTGDSSSQIILNNIVHNAQVTLKNTNLIIGLNNTNTSTVFNSQDTSLIAKSGAISLVDNKTSAYYINKLVSEDTKWNIDVDWLNKSADTINLTSDLSSGEVKLDSIRVLNSAQNQGEDTYKIQIIKGAVGNETSSNVQLNLDNLDISRISAETPYIKDVYSNSIIGTIDTNINLGTTTTLNDSIVIKGVVYDTLEYIAGLVTVGDEAKTFTFADTYPTYTYNKANLDVVGTLTIQGSNSNTNKIDFSNATDLNITNSATLEIKNTTISNTNSITNNNEFKAENSIFENIKEFVNKKVAAFKNVEFKSETDKITNNSLSNIKFENSTINASVQNDGTIEFSGDNIVKGKIDKDTTGGKIVLNEGNITIENTISNQEISNNGSNTTVEDVTYLAQNNSLLMQDGNFNIVNLGLNTLNFNTLNLNGGAININSTDADLQTGAMGRITASSYGTLGSGVINVENINVISDSNTLQTNILFADSAIKDAVQTGITEVSGPIYKYSVKYVKDGEFGPDGYFNFNRIVNSDNTSVGFSPSALIVPAANLTVGQAAVSQTFEYSFEHIDRFFQNSLKERMGAHNRNSFAISEHTEALKYNNNEEAWMKPYTNFETMNLDGGPKVDAISYGTFIGYNTDFKKLKNGWNKVGTGYISYMGSIIDYDSVDMTTNGGMIGTTQSFEKGNLFTAITIAAGASAGQATSEFGQETFTMIMSGIASKTGYNFEFKDGAFIVQPSMLIGYSFVKTFDYTNAAGVKINSEPLHSLQLYPNIKFIGNTKNGWQPYATVGLVWNLINEQNVRANDIILPHMSVDPYIQYGIGIQKKWKDKITAFGQAIVRNGGRNGVSLMFGMNFALGKDYSENKLKKETL